MSAIAPIDNKRIIDPIKDSRIVGPDIQVEEVGLAAAFLGVGGGFGDGEVHGRIDAFKDVAVEACCAGELGEPDGVWDVGHHGLTDDDPGVIQGAMGDDIRIQHGVRAELDGEVFPIAG
jgi:hypothetical protein